MKDKNLERGTLRKSRQQIVQRNAEAVGERKPKISVKILLNSWYRKMRKIFGE